VEWQQEIQEAFRAVDIENSGLVGYQEIKAAMRALGLPAKKSLVLASMREHGCQVPERGERVDFDAFEQILSERFRELDPQDTFVKAFKLFDQDGRGRITYADLKRVDKQLGNIISEEDLKRMLNVFDLNRDGELNEVEFAQALNAMSLR